MVNTTHLAVPAEFHTSQLVLYAILFPINIGFSCYYFVTGEDKKIRFFYSLRYNWSARITTGM
jgi:hypothetical protein